MKEMDKVLQQTLSSYLVILSVIFLLKIFGVGDYSLDHGHVIINQVNDFIVKCNLENVWGTLILFINTYVVTSITLNDKGKKIFWFCVALLPIQLLLNYIKTNVDLPYLFVIIDLVYLVIILKAYSKIKEMKFSIGNYFMIMTITFVFQMLSVVSRGVDITNETSIVTYLILNIDYLLMLFILYKWYFMTGGESLWVVLRCYYSDRLTFWTKQLKELQVVLSKTKKSWTKKSTHDKIHLSLFVFFATIYNLFSVWFIIMMAKLNGTVMECVLITITFWINKRSFGQPFHCRNTINCFMLSSLTYYILNRVSPSASVTLLMPIVVGIVFSLTMSTLTNIKCSKPRYIYKGMDRVSFEQAVSNLDVYEDYITVCKMYYVEDYNEIQISMKMNYSMPMVKKIKRIVKDKLKETH